MKRSTRFALVSLSALTAAGALEACRSLKDPASEVLAAGGPPIESAVYDPIVASDPAVDPERLLTDKAPITLAPELDTTLDQAPAIPDRFQPMTFKGIKGKQAPFAGATVLAALRRLRRYYNQSPFEARSGTGVKVKVKDSFYEYVTNPAHGSLSALDSFTSFGPVWNTDAAGTAGSNLGVMPPWWSDLQVHFYLTAPHTRHGCWTYAMITLGDRGTNEAAYASARCKDPFKKGETVPWKDLRKAYWDICTGAKELRPDFADTCGGLGTAIQAIPLQNSAYNLMWVDASDPAHPKFVDLPENIRTEMWKVPPTPGAVKNLEGIKWANEQRKLGHVNVWDYIMLSSTFAFDFKQQQAVLNAWFGDNRVNTIGAPAPTKPFPADDAECNTYRTTRAGDAPGVTGTVCDPMKSMQGYRSIGR
jgi:hypothetical protein